MSKDQFKVIGVMSGTSLDGIDLIYVSFSKLQAWNFTILHSETIPYNTNWLEILGDLVNYDTKKLKEIDKKYTSFLAQVIIDFIKKNNIETIDAICSHGHTALHKPEEHFTYQIGNLSGLATKLKRTVVCDFRVQDVKLGGQGAPLVPIGDKLLFSEFDFCLNLGGFANISMDIEGERIAYDICPVNIVLNHYTRKIGLDFDENGNIAASGTVNTKLLQELNQIDFYSQDYPKSLGLEWVKSKILPLIDTFSLEIKDVLRTFCEHIVIQITKEINKKEQASVLVTGGGAYNTFIMDRLKMLNTNTIKIPNKEIVEFKEALIFALLGVLKLQNKVNCLKSVTGASKNHSSGVIFQP